VSYQRLFVAKGLTDNKKCVCDATAKLVAYANFSEPVTFSSPKLWKISPKVGVGGGREWGGENRRREPECQTFSSNCLTDLGE